MLEFFFYKRWNGLNLFLIVSAPIHVIAALSRTRAIMDCIRTIASHKPSPEIQLTTGTSPVRDSFQFGTGSALGYGQLEYLPSIESALL